MDDDGDDDDTMRSTRPTRTVSRPGEIRTDAETGRWCHKAAVTLWGSQCHAEHEEQFNSKVSTASPPATAEEPWSPTLPRSSRSSGSMARLCRSCRCPIGSTRSSRRWRGEPGTAAAQMGGDGARDGDAEALSRGPGDERRGPRKPAQARPAARAEDAAVASRRRGCGIAARRRVGYRAERSRAQLILNDELKMGFSYGFASESFKGDALHLRTHGIRAISVVPYICYKFLVDGAERPDDRKTTETPLISPVGAYAPRLMTSVLTSERLKPHVRRSINPR